MPAVTTIERFGPKEVILRNNVKMPIFGLGTSHSGGFSSDAVLYAVSQCSYRLIDTAKRYGVEAFLKGALSLSRVPREDLFLTTKLWCTDYGKSTTRKTFNGSCARLGVNYLDLYMLHWPMVPSSCNNKEKILQETWRELELLYDEGLCRAIGVSNYDVDDLEKLMETATIHPHVNQVEFHPFQNPVHLHDFCKDHKIQMEGYCPLGKGKLLTEKAVLKIASLYSRTPAQILIRWSIQSGVVTIPKSTKVERVKENSEVFDFQLSNDDMALLNSLHEGRKIIDSSKVQENIDSYMPDGYKLKFANCAHNSNFT